MYMTTDSKQIGKDHTKTGIALENLLWSEEEYTISDFVDKFTLPQIVKVQEGYYGPDEDSCLGAEQILFLHIVKHTEKVLARDKKRRELHIPLNCSQKVELRPHSLKDVYEKASEIASTFPKFVRVTQGYYSLEDDGACLNPGDKLELKRVVPGEKEDYLVLENIERFPVRLPLSVVAGFQPLLDGREYYLKEVTNSQKPPIYFQFVDPPNIAATGGSSVFNSALGVMKLEKVYTDSTVICSTKVGNERTVVTCPKQLQVTVAAAQGMLVGDNDYMRVCRFFHDGINLTRVENLETYNVYASRDTLREYLYDDSLPPAPTSPPFEGSEVPKLMLSPPEIDINLEQARKGDQDERISQTSQGSSHSSEALASSSGNINKQQGSTDDEDEHHDYEYISDDEMNRLANLKVNKDSNGHEEKHHGQGSEEFPENKDQNEALDSQMTDEKGPKEENPIDNSENQGSDVDYINMADQVPQVSNYERKSETASIKMKPQPPPTKPKPEIPAKVPQTKPGSTSQHMPATSSEKYTLPSDLSVLNTGEVAEFLEHVHLKEFVTNFEYNQIDGDMLVSLDEDMLESLGMNVFQRRKLLKLINGWRPKLSIKLGH